MLDSDNMISTSVSEAVEKISSYRWKRLSQMLLYVFYFAKPEHTNRKLTVEIIVYLVVYIQCS